MGGEGLEGKRGRRKKCSKNHRAWCAGRRRLGGKKIVIRWGHGPGRVWLLLLKEKKKDSWGRGKGTKKERGAHEKSVAGSSTLKLDFCNKGPNTPRQGMWEWGERPTGVFFTKLG